MQFQKTILSILLLTQFVKSQEVVKKDEFPLAMQLIRMQSATFKRDQLQKVAAEINQNPESYVQQLQKDFNFYKLTESTSKTAAMGATAIAKIAGMSNMEVAQVNGIVQSIGSIVSNASLMALGSTQLAAMGVCSAMPVVGIVAGIISLVGSFDDSEGMAEALGQISQQISIFHDNVMIRFDGIENFLDESHRKVMASFIELHKQGGDIKNKIAELKRESQLHAHQIFTSLQDLKRQSVLNNKEILSQFATIHTDEIKKVVSEIEFDLSSGNINPENLAKTIHKLSDCINITARNSSLTGSENKSLAYTLTTESLTNPFAHPAFSNINLVKKFYEDKFKINLGQNLVNPLVFVDCALSLINLVEKVEMKFSSEQGKLTCLQDLNNIHAQAMHTLKVIQVLNKKEFLESLTQECQLALEGLAKQEVDAAQATKVKLDQIQAETLRDVQTKDISTVQSQPNVHLAQAEQTKNELTSAISKLSQGPCWERVFASEYQLLLPNINSVISQNKAIQQQSRTTFQQIASGHRHPLQPASVLVCPHPKSHPNNKYSFACNEIRVNPTFIQAERLGLGTIQHFYHCSSNSQFIIDTAFFVGKNNYHSAPYDQNNGSSFHIKRTIMPFPVKATTDEFVFFFWNGGRYLNNGETYNKGSGTQTKPGNSNKFLSGKLTEYNQGLADIGKLVNQKEQEEENKIKQEMLKGIEVSGNTLHNATKVLEERTRILESVAALTLNENLGQSRALQLLNSLPVKDKESVVKRIRETRFNSATALTSGGTELKQLAQTLSENPVNFRILETIIAKIEGIIRYVADAPVEQKESLEGKVQQLSATQAELKADMQGIKEQMAGLQQSTQASIAEGFAKIMAAIQGLQK